MEQKMSRYKQPYTIFKRGKYWYYRTYDTEGVRTSAKTTGCKLKSEARIYCEKLIESGEMGSSEKLFRIYAEHFFDDNSPYLIDRVSPLAENTIKQYRYCLNQKILPFFSSIKLNEIKYTTLRNFRSEMIENNLSVSTINSTMKTLKLILTDAFRDRLIKTNPFDYLDSYKKDDNERDAFTLEEVKYLIKEMPEEFKNFIRYLALTGMRISEAVGVTDEDIKQGNGFIYIDLNRQFNDGKYKPLKWGKKRGIPVLPEVDALKGFDPIRLQWFYKCFQKIKPSFKDYEERNLAFHSLRHFFVTNAKVFGINPLFVEVLAGHSLKGIEKTYTNLKTEDLVSILEWQKKTFIELNK
ncbi:MAG: phage integrase SAM-like domain-containing protein [Treponema sp.]|nr:phage integrase SAM-like domain-containing protein [Treponema sp.]